MSKIEWTEKSWNPVVGCTPVSPGCLNCYAATMARRLEAMGRAEYAPREMVSGACGENAVYRIAEVRGGRAVFTGDVRTVPDRLGEPLKWRKPVRVFVNSMSDLFHEAVPFEFIDRVFAVMALASRHTFQVLTKRPERMAEYLATFDGEDGCANDSRHEQWAELALALAPSNEVWIKTVAEAPWPLPNVGLGTSVERQKEADERIPHLLRCPAAVRFLSCEPLLEAIDLTRVNFGVPGIQNVLDCRVSELAKRAGIDKLNGVDWVIVGGESGPHARPCDVAWVRSIVAQCRAAGVPCFVKQLGARPYDSAMTQTMCNGTVHYRQPADHPRANEHRELIASGKVHGYAVEPMSLLLKNKKGGDPAEWPEDLRVREFPQEKT